MGEHEIVGRPGDRHEQEADRAAERVTARPAGPAGPGEHAGPVGHAGHAVAAGHGAATPGEQHDEPALLRAYGGALGHDFSRVRLHDDATAHAVTRRFGAEAVTIGHHVLFAPGRRDPASSQGRRLLAHELTHVRQQASTGPRVQGKFVATGDAAGFVAMVNGILAVQNRIEVNAAGEVSVVATNVQGPPTRDATELLSAIRAMIADPKTVSIRFTRGSAPTAPADVGVIVGSYTLSAVDLDDIEKFGADTSHSQTGSNSAAVLLHELVEQHRKQAKGEAYATAHPAGIAAEEAALGAQRVIDVPRRVPGGVEMTTTYRYPDGREVDVAVTISTATGNVTNVRRTVRPARSTP